MTLTPEDLDLIRAALGAMRDRQQAAFGGPTPELEALIAKLSAPETPVDPNQDPAPEPKRTRKA